MFILAETSSVCRDVRNECDLPEYCEGGTASCPRDTFTYPGQSCTAAGGYSGLCSAGKCESLEATCTIDITRDFAGDWDSTEECARYNDDCSYLVCHNASEAVGYMCGQSFSTHGKQMTVPDGTPCWFPGSTLGSRVGMCYAGSCHLPHALAVVPLCGNGGIDFGEECDCGESDDPCCECSTCMLKEGSSCSSTEPCCDSTCNFETAGTVCRAAIGDCDIEEVCSGDSGVCPSDVGEQWGTACTASDGAASTCYGKVCLASLDTQCDAYTIGDKPFGCLDMDAKPDPFNSCSALACSASCEQLTGNYVVNGESVTDPYWCNGCSRSSSSTSFTVNGETNTIYLSGALDGTVLADSSQICLGSESVTPDSSCSSGEFLEISVGRCLPCDTGCFECVGPSNFDCTGDCRYAADTRGACAISAEQAEFAAASPGVTPAPTPSPTSAPTSAPTPAPTPAPTSAPTSAPTPAPTPAPATPTPSPSSPSPPDPDQCDNAAWDANDCDFFNFGVSPCNGATLPGVSENCTGTGTGCKVHIGYGIAGYNCSQYCGNHSLGCSGAWYGTCEDETPTLCSTIFDENDALCECEGFSTKSSAPKTSLHQAETCLAAFDEYKACVEEKFSGTPEYEELWPAPEIRDRIVAAIEKHEQPSCVNIPKSVAEKLRAIPCPLSS